jgi:anti-anti-sigma regulatory factor
VIISQAHKDGKQVMEVSGDLTVANSLKLKKAVLANFKKGDRFEIALGDVTDMDLSFIQIILAAIKTAEKDDKEFALRIPVPELVVKGLESSGFLNHTRCEKTGCIWCSILAQVQGA